MKEKVKEGMSKKKTEKHDKGEDKEEEDKDDNQDEDKADVSKLSKEKPNEEEKEPKGKEEVKKKEPLEKKQKRSGSHDQIKHQKSSSKAKSIIKKSDISFNAFKNCSGVQLRSFLSQMNFIQKRSSKIFLKACSNLCEVEVIKHYDADMNIKSETKIIRLKDFVLKEYIAKTAKESSAEQKQIQTDKKEIGPIISPSFKSGAQTDRQKGQSPASSGVLNIVKDSFLKASLKSASKFFPKPNQYIIFLLMSKILDKFCEGNFENWVPSVAKNAKDQEKQYILSYSTLLSIFNKIIKSYPSAAALIFRFKPTKLKYFTSFVDFLVRKIYPIGFIKWS